MHSIRYKATAITIAEILTAMLCVFLASYTIIQAENDHRSVEMMDLLVQDTGKSIEEYTGDIERSVDMVANLVSDSLDGLVLSRTGAIGTGNTVPAQRTALQTEQLDAYMAEFAEHIQGEFAAIAEHTNGVQTYYFVVSPNISTSEHGFYYSHVGRTGFYKRDPFVVSDLDPNDPDHSGWYFTPIQRGMASWIGPFPATSLNELLICSYVVPIYKSGTLIGILGMDIPLDTLISLVSPIVVYDTGFACLFDENGRVIYHPEQDYGSMLNTAIDDELFQQDSSANMLIRYEAKTGERRQLSFKTLSTGMKLAVVAPTDEVNASSTRLTVVNLPIALVIVALFAVLTLFIMGRLTKPLQLLTAASQRLANADYDVQLDYYSNDEVGALTTSFRRMRDQIEKNIEDLNHQVLTDDLTGLPNHRHFFELAIKERDRLVACNKKPVMLYFNLVGMKYFNRQYGFAEGDKLICAVARILAEHFGEQKMSRFAQDHFAAVSDEDNLEERLRALFKDIQRANDGKTLPVSVGIYQHSLGDVNVSNACDRAKFACDSRGDSFFSGYSYFTKAMQHQTEVTRYVINHLSEAIENNWIAVCYQPIIRAVNGRVCDEEALSRWNDPEMGLLPPNYFIPALEGAGLIYRLDIYVLEQVLAKMQLQNEAGLTVVPHSINLSRSDFDSCDIVDEVCSRVDAADIPRNMISIEITESMVGSDFEFMKAQIERFQSLGFPIWIDDFGSGYSSLDFLQSFNFDLLKFDMSFLRKLDEGPNGKIILTELMRMATTLGVETICEGVETSEQVRFLREIGCSRLQGYYYSKAIAFSEILARYEEGRQIGYENPAESDYYEAVGKVNLHDLTSIAQKNDDTLQNAFNTVPMAVLELSNDSIQLVRTNQTFRDFLRRFISSPLYTASTPSGEAPPILESLFKAHAYECCNNGANRIFFDETLSDGSIAHCLIRHIRTNEVTGTRAVVVAVLSIISSE